MVNDILSDTKQSMEQVIDALKKQLIAIRTGRANANMLDAVRVDYYDTPTPLNQIANISTPDPRLIVVKPYEKKLIKDIEKAIVEANLGFNPTNDGELVRVPLPPLSTERRKEYVKLAKTRCEDAKVAVRAARRDSNEMLKAAADEKSITDDDETRGKKSVQDLTDAYVKKIDDMLAAKEKEIMEV
jgi:ribosome recycling factor